MVGNATRRSIVLPLINAPRAVKRAAVVVMDALLCAAATIIAIYLRLGYLPPATRPLVFATLLSIILSVGILWLGRAYGILFRYVSGTTVRVITRNVLLYAVPYAGVFTYYGINGVPRTLGLLQPTILLLLILSGRAVLAHVIAIFSIERVDRVRPRVLIYGCGSAGRQLLAALRQSQDMVAVGFVDDDITLSGQILDGIKVYRPKELESVISRKDVSGVMLAIPSATRKRRNEIILDLRQYKINVRTLPGMLDLAHGRVKVSDLHDVAVDDLLGRNRVSPDQALIRRNIVGKVVLVTGAGGSIGSELCRQIIEGSPITLLLLDHSEYALYSIHREIESLAAAAESPVKIVALLGSIANYALIDRVFVEWRPNVIFHAAAYKHVPLVEQNVVEAVRNNVIGTYNVARAALDHKVKNFVLISTDKAVRPTSIMGTTKRLAEQVLQGMAEIQDNTCFCMVRFGNVLGSSGSVVPLFRAQVHAGGPITITHREMTRYFMLIPEAAQLVIQAGAMSQGGEVFLLDMGEPVKIIDLAHSVVALSGLTVRDSANPDGDIEICEVGLRPGEKLYEELLIDNDAVPSDHPLIMKANESFMPWNILSLALENMRDMIDKNDEAGLKRELSHLVPEYAVQRAKSGMVS